MRVGQLVVCVDDSFPAHVAKFFDALPVKGQVYTLREVSLGRGKLIVVKDGKQVPNGGSENHPEVRVLLEELKNGPDPLSKYGHELGFNAERFRELDTNVETVADVRTHEDEAPVLVPVRTDDESWKEAA